MLVNDQFLSSFVSTLGVIAVLATIAGVGFAFLWVWRLSQPVRGWFQRNFVTHLIRATETALELTRTLIENLVAGLLTLLTQPWQVLAHALTTLKEVLRKIPWGSCTIVLVIYALPFLVFGTAGMTIQSALGVVAAGTLIGTLCALFVILRHKQLGAGKALCTIAGGIWSSSMLIAILIVMASD